MPSVCLYFEVHQPFRLRRYPAQDVGRRHDYFDAEGNARILRKVARGCYEPANATLLRLVLQSEGRLRLAFSLTGTLIDQLSTYAPCVLDGFRALVDTGCVELLAETDAHSLAAIHDEAEFGAEVQRHASRMEALFGQRPRVFRNTELIYNDRIGTLAADLGYEAVLVEGADDVLADRSPHVLYRHPERDLLLLAKSYRLSDDIAFRFSNRSWSEHPLTAEKFASWVHGVAGGGEVVNLFMDYETFGEHQWADSGIFEFLDALPARLLARAGWDFLMPSEVIERYAPVGTLSFPRDVSWADEARDLSAWQGNRMQRKAMQQAFALADAVRRRNNPVATEVWRRLLTSDHFYYMSTKSLADGDVHAYFSPYDSPYEAFLNYMNVLEDFERSLLRSGAGVEAA